LDKSASYLDGGGGAMDVFVLRVEREKQNRKEGKKLPGEEGGRGPGLLVGIV